jgi:signal transduction histidine kinase
MSSPVATELLIRADRARVVASIARGMAHDLRGPLQTLTLLLSPSGDLLAGPEERRLRMALSDAVHRLSGTVDRFGQVYAPVQVAAAPVVVGELLDYVAALQRYQRGEPAIEVALQVDRGLPAVRAGMADLTHVLLGVILNAKEAMVERPQSRITLTASQQGREVRIVVEDNGPGLSEPARQRAFEPFFTTRPGHLGIGLTVARWLAQRDGGELDLEAGMDGGTRVGLRVPIWQKTLEEDEAVPGVTVSGSPSRPRPGGP